MIQFVRSAEACNIIKCSPLRAPGSAYCPENTGAEHRVDLSSVKKKKRRKKDDDDDNNYRMSRIKRAFYPMHYHRRRLQGHDP